MHFQDPAPNLGGPQRFIPPITIAVMGATGSGKSSFINMASGSNLPVGKRLESCTAEVEPANQFILDNRPVILIDTPGFDDSSKSDTAILKLIAAFLATTYEAGSKLAGVIYITRISDNRFSGIAGRNFRMFRELCGDTSLQNVILLTNMWGQVTQDVGEEREEELATKFFKPVLDKGARLARHHNTVESAHDVIRSIMKNVPVPLRIQRELVDEGRNIDDTAAGAAINEELNEKIKKHKEELKSLRDEMEELREKDAEARQEMEEDARKLREEMNQMRAESANMKAGYEEEKRKIEEKMSEKIKEMQEQARKDREADEAARKEYMDALKKQLEDQANNSAEMREKLQQQVKNLEDQWNNRDQGWQCAIM